MGHNLVKACILLAVWNGEKYLPSLLDSLSSQSDGDFTVIWQDDGSTDNSLSLMRAHALKDSRFQEGSEGGRHFGAAGNFLSLLRQAKGDLIFLCDQDDIWEEHKVRCLKAAIAGAMRESGESLPLLVHSDCSVIDQAGNQLEPSFFRLQGWDPSAVDLPRLLVQNNATGCTMLLNRPLTDLVCRYGNPQTMFMHDWFIVLSAASFGRVIFADEPLTRYRQHGDNAIGASKSSLPVRALRALRQRKKAKDRIRLTYTHTRAFRDSYGSALPEKASDTVSRYLATESLPKISRILAVRRMGCVMQSPLTRLGQILFG